MRGFAASPPRPATPGVSQDKPARSTLAGPLPVARLRRARLRPPTPPRAPTPPRPTPPADSAPPDPVGQPLVLDCATSVARRRPPPPQPTRAGAPVLLTLRPCLSRLTLRPCLSRLTLRPRLRACPSPCGELECTLVRAAGGAGVGEGRELPDIRWRALPVAGAGSASFRGLDFPVDWQAFPHRPDRTSHRLGCTSRWLRRLPTRCADYPPVAPTTHPLRRLPTRCAVDLRDMRDFATAQCTVSARNQGEVGAIGGWGWAARDETEQVWCGC
jgi:hypothetical protein